jgi:hypothetical protein
MMCLAQDTTEVAELQEDVTRMRVAAVMVGARAARAKRLAQERGVWLVTTHGEVDEAAFRVSALEGVLMAMCRA